NQMDLPPEKAKLLRQYDDEKKWDLICDQELVHAKAAPSVYISKIKKIMEPGNSSKRQRKNAGLVDPELERPGDIVTDE
ncbi:putative formin-like protein 3, partial [Apostichopus japonicus]